MPPTTQNTIHHPTPDPTPNHPIYDVVIVGAGMFGASAARHVRRLRPRHTLAVVGPADNASALARGQHHDVARITRVADAREQQAMLNYVALGGYADTAAAARAAEEEEETKQKEENDNEKGGGAAEVLIEPNSDFYTPCGLVWAMGSATREAVHSALSSLPASGPIPPRAAVLDTDNSAPAATAPAAAAVEQQGAVEKSLLTAEEARGRMRFETDGTRAEALLGGEVFLRHLPPSSHPSVTAGVGDTFFLETPGDVLLHNTSDNKSSGNSGSNARMPLAGTVDPARYVAAQLSAAAVAAPREAFTRVVAVVTAVSVGDGETEQKVEDVSGGVSQQPQQQQKSPPSPPTVVTLTLDDGRTIRGRRVLVAAAAFSQYLSLLPSRRLARATAPVAEFVVLLRVSPPHAEGTVEGVSDVAHYFMNGESGGGVGVATGGSGGDNDDSGGGGGGANVKEYLAAHARNLEASRRVPCVMLTRGPPEGQFYCLPPRYYPDRAGWFIKAGSSNHTCRTTPPFSQLFDFSVDTHAKAMAWHRGEKTLPRRLTDAYERQLPALFPGWPVVPETAEERAAEELQLSREAEAEAEAEEVKKESEGNEKTEGAGDGNSTPTTPAAAAAAAAPPLRNRYVIRCIWDKTRSGAPIIDYVRVGRAGSGDDATALTAGTQKGDAQTREGMTPTHQQHQQREAEEAEAEAEGNACDGRDGLYCAVGGNGRGAKNCDTIGEVAAHRVLGEPLPPRLAVFDGMFRLQQEEGVSW